MEDDESELAFSVRLAAYDLLMVSYDSCSLSIIIIIFIYLSSSSIIDGCSLSIIILSIL